MSAVRDAFLARADDLLEQLWFGRLGEQEFIQQYAELRGDWKEATATAAEIVFQRQQRKYR